MISNGNKQNNNLKHLQIKRKSSNKRNEEDKSSLHLNNSKKSKNQQKSAKEKKTFLTNENNNNINTNTNNIFWKIPKPKLSIHLDGIKKNIKNKTYLNEQEIFNQKGITFFNDIIKKKKLKKHNSKTNTNMIKSFSKTRKKVNSFIPSQKQLLKIMQKDKLIYTHKSIKKKEKINQVNYSSSPSVNPKTNKKKNYSRTKASKIYIKNSNSSIIIIKNNTNVHNNNLNINRSKSIIRKSINKKGSKDRNKKTKTCYN